MTASITSSESFGARAQRSEERRVILWVGVLIVMIAISCARRWMGGVVMSENRVFFPTLAVLLAAVVLQIPLLIVLRRANRAARLLPGWLWRASSIADLCVPVAMLTISAFESPRGAVPALSAPPLLLLPLVVMMSILRLRPIFTLRAGLAGAVFHWCLAARALAINDGSSNQAPVFIAYGSILVLIAVTGMLVARDVKQHVVEAADEAAAREKADQHLAAVRHDLAVARDIQAGLLPQSVPDFEGFDIAGMNTPADLTGGDYYDWQKLSDGRLLAVMADVSGHGIGPALVMAVCRAYARASADIIPDPTKLMARLNELLHPDLPADRFITFAIAMLNSNGGIELLSAGHGPTLLYRAATGEIQQFGGDGIPLGIMPEESYGPTATFTLERGDVMVMLTDGFFEWARPSDDQAFGIERLCETLRNTAARDAQSILRTMDGAVRNFCAGSPQHDDMTAIVIRRTV